MNPLCGDKYKIGDLVELAYTFDKWPAQKHGIIVGLDYGSDYPDKFVPGNGDYYCIYLVCYEEYALFHEAELKDY